MASTWALDRTQTYKENAHAWTLTFAGFGTLNGGSAADTFNLTHNRTSNITSGGGTTAYVFSAGVVLTGSNAEGSDRDDLDLSAYTTAVRASLTGSSASGFGGTVTGI